MSDGFALITALLAGAGYGVWLGYSMRRDETADIAIRAWARALGVKGADDA